MVEDKKVPEIRFEGFSDNWEVRKITDVAKIFIGLVTTMTSNYCSEGVLLIRNSDIKEGYFDFDDYPIHLDEGFAEDNATRKLKMYDIVTVHTGDVGTSAVVGERESGAIGFATINTRPDTKLIESNFLATFFNTEKHKKWAIQMSTGDGRNNYNLYDFTKLRVPVPELEEQTVIGSFFGIIDDTIALKKRLHKKTVNIKKAMLDKMFPKNETDVPDIRFDGFEGAWNCKLLTDVADIVGGGTPNTSIPDYWGGNIDWYSPIEIGTTVYANNSQRKITELGLSKCSATVLPANKTILFTSRAGIGDMAILTKAAATNQGFQPLVMKDGNDVYFTYSMGHLIKDYALRNSSGSTFLEISGKTLGAMTVYYPPSLDEQTAIGNFFRNLDILIQAQREELEKLQNIKKACLNKMFI